MTDVQDESFTEEDDELAIEETSARSRWPLLVALAAIIGGLILICLFGALLLWPDGDPVADDLNGGNDPDLIAVPVNSEVVIIAGDGNETISVTLETPISLDIDGQRFSVETQQIGEDGSWPLSGQEEETAVWVYGSIINYVFGLRDSAANREALNQLELGDEIVFTTRGGANYTFAFSSLEQVTNNSTEIFAQQSPGITIALVGADGEERQVAHGRYVVSDTKEESDGRIVELGETAQLENLQLMVSGVTYLFDRPEIPDGFAFYLIDYQIRNIGATAVESGDLNVTLTDDLGNQYALNPTASGLGNFPLLRGTIAPGQTIAATAGYQIPASLNSTLLRWQVRYTPSGSQIQVNIPFSEGQSEEKQTVVQVEQAQVSTDGTRLTLLGQVTNLGEQPLAIQERHISLSGDGTVYLIFSTNPAFPWVIGPGQTVPFSLTFQRPLGDSAVFQILNQPFAINGLQ